MILCFVIFVYYGLYLNFFFVSSILFIGFTGFDGFLGEKYEIDQYLDALRLDHTQELAILLWWKENATRYPIVAQMARDMLSIPITTVASESSFSMGSRVLTKWRSSLHPSTADALLSTHSWLFGFHMEEG